MQPDGFPIGANDPHAEAHYLLGHFLEEVPHRVVYNHWDWSNFEDYDSGRMLLKAEPEFQGTCFLAAHRRYFWNIKQHTPADTINNTIRSHAAMCFQIVPRFLYCLPLEFNESDILLLVQQVAGPDFDWWWYYQIPRALDFLEVHIADRGLSDQLCEFLARWSDGIHPHRDKSDARKNAWRLDCLIGRAAFGRLEPGEPWADAAKKDLEALDSLTSKKWQDFLVHVHNCDISRPSPNWLQRARRLSKKLVRRHS